MNRLNRLLKAIIRVAIVALIFQICRTLFIASNSYFFTDTSFTDTLGLMWGGLRYDLAIVLLINIPYILLSAFNRDNRVITIVTKSLFIAVNLLAIIFIAIDILYFPYTLERLTFGFFGYLETQKNLDILLWRFMGDYWYALFLFVGLIWLIVKGYNSIDKIRLSFTSKFKRAHTVYTSAILVVVYTCCTTLLWIKDGKILSINDAWTVAETPFEVAATTNTPYNMLSSLIYNTESIHLEQTKSITYKPDTTKQFSRKNVVVIILEGFTREASALLNPDLENGKYKGYTPFLDSLMKQGMYFTNAYSNGRRSIDAVPAVLASVPAIIRGDRDKSDNIITLLKRYNYTTQFFHGAHNGSMHFDRYCNTIGIDEYHGLNEFNNIDEFDGTWGIWDEPFLQYMAQKQNITKEPFISVAFNLSSHNPYVLPAKYNGKIKEGIDPICKCIQYSDIALKEYFKTVSEYAWYNNTVFVFTADHAIIPWHNEYKGSREAFAIPLFFFTPDGTIKGANGNVAQQIDIMPTLLNYLNYPAEFRSAGNNQLNKDSNHRAVTSIVRIPQIIDSKGDISWIKSDGQIVKADKQNRL